MGHLRSTASLTLYECVWWISSRPRNSHVQCQLYGNSN